MITEGHLPKWLNIDNDKLIVVKHSEYISNKYLPTFNSNVIELNFGNISSLGEKFVLFNDDIFINAKTKPSDYFYKGIPKDVGIFSPIIAKEEGVSTTVLNNVKIINSYFNSRDVIKSNPSKWFSTKYGKHLLKNVIVLPWKDILGFYDSHLAISYDKKLYKNVINETINKDLVFRNSFRGASDVSHWLVRYWQLCLGDFTPRSSNFGKYYDIGSSLDDIKKDIKNSKHSIICLNDSNVNEGSFEKYKQILIDIFQSKYSKKSTFEK